jgi:hypothetical protein
MLLKSELLQVDLGSYLWITMDPMEPRNSNIPAKALILYLGGLYQRRHIDASLSTASHSQFLNKDSEERIMRLYDGVEMLMINGIFFKLSKQSAKTHLNRKRLNHHLKTPVFGLMICILCAIKLIQARKMNQSLKYMVKRHHQIVNFLVLQRIRRQIQIKDSPKLRIRFVRYSKMMN